MTQTVSAQDARNKFSEMLNTAVYGKTKIIITRFNKPQVVLIDYKEYEFLTDPTKRFTNEEWEKGFKVFDRIRARTRGILTKEVKQIVDEAVKTVRREKRAKGGN
ncbi:type II toxin-antitoxin system Phd/YefM family antitoxin [Candidatus Gottesmanbacteria bacterium]|nr:type II toxin-antitoxin system Phd/YefM family antitoxin [Candidatus Gottesmanbacteria bacterium]